MDGCLELIILYKWLKLAPMSLFGNNTCMYVRSKEFMSILNYSIFILYFIYDV